MRFCCSALTIAALFLVWSTQVAAAPSIGGLSGEVREGSTLTLRGAGFGQFGGEIVSWDDFEAHENGTPLNGISSIIGGRWTTQYSYTGRGARIDSQRTHSGSRAAHLDWSIDSHTIRAFGWGGRGPYSRLFISYWRYMTGNYSAEDGDNHKQFYLFGTHEDFPQLMPLIPARTTTWGIYNNVGDAAVPYSERNNINQAGWNYANTTNRYQRWDFWLTLNDVGIPNGTVMAWVDGVLGIQNRAYNSRRVNGLWDDFRLGHMAQGFNDSARAWFDDVYIATTQARVELCDSPTWANCRTREIQIVDPSTWSESQLSFKLRRGGLTDLENKYLYVVDQYGNANADGYAIDGGSSGEVQPMAPGNIQVR